MKSNQTKDSLVIGFALFAVFFGAGNMIFPAYLGANAGTEWPIALLATILASVIIPILAVIAVANIGEGFAETCAPVGKWYYKFIFFLTVVFVVVLANLPRTAATTYELGIAPLFPNIPVQPVIIVYFAITLFIAFDKGGFVDRIGKYLTPVLLVILLIIIAKGIISPLGTPIETNQENTFGNAFLELYSTGDIFSGLMFSTMFISSVVAKGYKEESVRKSIMRKSAIVAGVIFAIVYGGLLVLGATANGLFPRGIDRTELLAGIVQKLLGNVGVAGMAIAVALACLTTASGLTVMAADFLCDLTKNKISYKVWVVIICILGGIIGTTGVENIISTAGPAFLAIYPSGIVLTFVALFKRFLPNMGAYKYSVIFALVAGLLDSANALGLGAAGSIMSLMPLYSLGFGWVLPAVVGFVFGAIKYKVSPPKVNEAAVD